MAQQPPRQVAPRPAQAPAPRHQTPVGRPTAGNPGVAPARAAAPQGRPAAAPAQASQRAPAPARHATSAADNFRGIENTQPDSRLPRLTMPGTYRVLVEEAKYFFSSVGRAAVFVAEVRTDANSPTGEGLYSVVTKEGKYPDAFMGFIRGFVASAMAVDLNTVDADFTAEALSMPDAAPNSGAACGRYMLVNVIEKMDKKTGLVSDWPTITFLPDDQAAGGGSQEYVDADGDPCDADGNPF